MLELNLWFSPTTGATYGNLTTKTNHQVQNIDNLLSIQKFCALSQRLNLMDTETLDLFINDSSRDHEALYAWTKDRTAIVWWNESKKTAHGFINGKEHTFTLLNHRYQVKGMPDLIFRCFQ